MSAQNADTDRLPDVDDLTHYVLATNRLGVENKRLRDALLAITRVICAVDSEAWEEGQSEDDEFWRALNEIDQIALAARGQEAHDE